MSNLMTSMFLTVAAWSIQAAVHQPTVWYRADTGVTLDEHGQVAKWENIGSLGHDLDLVPATAAEDGLTLEEDAFGSQPAIRFSGVDYLKTTVNTDAGIKAGNGAVFIVFDSTQPTRTAPLWGMSKSDGSARFAAWLNPDGHYMQTHWFGGGFNQSAPGVDSAQKGVYSLFLSPGGFLVGCWKAGRSEENWGSWPGHWDDQPLCIGYHGISNWDAESGAPSALAGRIAEVRFYEKTPSPHERFLIDMFALRTLRHSRPPGFGYGRGGFWGCTRRV